MTITAITAISPETASAPADDEVARRARYVAGLRVLATMLEDNPGLPLPYHGNRAPVTFHFLAGDDPGAAVTAAARALPCSWQQEVRDYGETGGGAYLDLNGDLGGLQVTLTVNRADVCEKVITGTRPVVRLVKDPDALAAVPLVEVPAEVTDVEWRCDPALAAIAPAASAPGVAVTATRTGIAAEVDARLRRGNGSS
jgi:hypothetical protein